MAEQMPKDSAGATRVVAVVVAILLVLSLVAGGVWYLSTSRKPESTQRQIQPSQVTTAPAPPSSAELSTPPSAEQSTTTEPTASGGAEEPKKQRAEKVAFRLGSTLYTAAEDGSKASSLVRAPAGPYALSPDGGTLAYVDSGALILADVASGRTSRVGDADDDSSLSWSSDSSRVAYRRKSSGDRTDIWTVAVDGTGAVKVAAGESANYAVKGAVLVTLDTQSSKPRILLFDGSKAPRSLPVIGGTPTAVAASGGRVFVAYSNGERGVSVVSMKFDGSDRKHLTGAVPGDYPAVWGGLAPSPDGRYLAVQSLGDDGYARAYVVPVSGGRRVDLNLRRDVLVRGWSADGARVFFIEGNAFQGEPTELASVRRDGSSRRDVVTGAQ